MEYLQSSAEKKVPLLKNYKIIGSYSGIRPATQFSDYQICHEKDVQWITVGGIRSTGLRFGFMSLIFKLLFAYKMAIRNSLHNPIIAPLVE